MSTKASVLFIKDGIKVAALHKHGDGYVFGGLGDDLVTILSETKFVDAGCLFANIVASLKKDIGGVYLCSPDQVARQGEDYIYELEMDNRGDNICLKVVDIYTIQTTNGNLPYQILYKSNS